MNSSKFTSKFEPQTWKSFDDILARMVLVVGGKEADVAKTLEISHQALSSAKAKQKIPARWFSKLAEKYDISMDWLRTGEGEMSRNGIVNDPRKLDKEQMRMAIIVIEEGLAKTKKRLQPEKKADLIFAAYDLLGSEKSRNNVIELIKIIA